MRSGNINYFAVGIFVLAMLAALIVALAVLSGRTGLVDTYYAVYDNVTGVKFGTLVVYEGYHVGQVEDVTPVEDAGRMRFRVELSVRQGWRIPADSVASIATSGLLAAATVHIRAGDSDDALKPGSTMITGGRIGLMAGVESVATQAEDLIEKEVKPLLAKVDGAVEGLNALLEGEGQTLFGAFEALASDVAQRGPRITENVERFTETMNRSGEQLEALLHPDNRARFEGLLDSLKVTVDDFDVLAADLRSLTADMAAVVGENRGDVAQSVDDVRYVAESLARRIESMNQNLEGASRNMLEFTRQIRQNPGVLLGGRRPPDAADRR